MNRQPDPSDGYNDRSHLYCDEHEQWHVKNAVGNFVCVSCLVEKSRTERLK